MRTLYQKGGPAVDLYDVRIRGGPGSPVEGDVDFFLRHARRTGGPVLELGVGTGRVAVPLARAGFEVVGLDLSPHMLAAARRKAVPGLTLVRGNMARFDLGRKFRLILIPFRAFQHLKTPREQRSCLECVRRHLAPCGRFIVDLFDPRLEFCLPERHRARMTRGRVRHPETGNSIRIHVEDRRNDPHTQTFSERWIHEERDAAGRVVRRWKDDLSLRWTYRFEMEYLLRLSGLEPIACYGDFRGSRPRYGAEQIWVCEA
ncbi:MAG: class I SAM-dependent methyltransferase [Planctomycetes bacterium]|nr:class I SAM-dependent methyltransferase [Planctomycetota bacterium]